MRAGRVLVETYRAPSERPSAGGPATDVDWLEPYPDVALEAIADLAPGPAARYEMHEAVQLAFVAAIQNLPPRQRAVLLLRDVLGWSAAETRVLLDTSATSVNSALQRARGTLRQRFPDGRPSAQPALDDRQRLLLDRYVRVWEGYDLDGLVALLREDAVLSMPPSQWYAGRAAIRAFVASVWTPMGGVRRRLVPTAANRQPAFAQYRFDPERSEWRPFAIQVLTLQEDAIAVVTHFSDPRLFHAFGLPAAQPTWPRAGGHLDAELSDR